MSRLRLRVFSAFRGWTFVLVVVKFDSVLGAEPIFEFVEVACSNAMVTVLPLVLML